MDEDMARDLARQFREHINYTGDAEQFDQEVIGLIKCVEDQCARVVEGWPPIMLKVAGNPLSLIAADIRGKI